MLKSYTKIRVRYGETDRMKYLHHGNYALYYEEARSKMLRELGVSYRDIEDFGVIMPVLEMTSRFYIPAKFDELLTIITYIKEPPKVRFKFEYEILNENNELVNTGTTTLVFADSKTGKPIRTPQIFKDLFFDKFS